MWFSDWKANVQKAYAYKLPLAVVYIDGKAGDRVDGLGRSQRAELRW